MPRLREFKWDSWADWVDEQIAQDKPEIIAVDTETTGLEYYDEPFAATLSWRGRDGSLRSGYIALEGENASYRRLLLGQILLKSPAWVFHNAKFDLQKLLLIGTISDELLEQTELHDTQTIYTLLDENGRKGLKHLAVTLLKYDDTIQVQYKSGKKKGQYHPVSREKHVLDAARRKLKLRKEDGYHLLPREIIVPYALRDTDFTLQLYEMLMPRLQAKDEQLNQLYASAMQLKRVLLRMEADGFKVDLEYLKEKTSEYGVRVIETAQRTVELSGHEDFNPASTDQVMSALMERGHYPENTEADTLRELGDELADAIVDYREVKKIHKTYLVGLQKIQRNGIAHPNFNDDAAKTGRMSSGSAKE